MVSGGTLWLGAILQRVIRNTKGERAEGALAAVAQPARQAQRVSSRGLKMLSLVAETS